jgi:integrase
MARIRLRYVHADIDRHGNTRYYFFKRGAPKKMRLPGLPGSAEFMAAYDCCLKGEPIAAPAGNAQQQIARAPSGTLQWLCNAYGQSEEFKALEPTTQSSKRSILKSICAEPVTPGSSARIGDLPFAQITDKAIKTLRDRVKDKPTTANNRLSSLRTLFAWAIDAEHFEGANPALAVPKKKVVSEGHHTWTASEIQQFEDAHPIGSRARLAFCLLCYTGTRISDVIRLGPRMMEHGTLKFIAKKNRNSKPVTVEIPVIPALQRIIDASTIGPFTFLLNELNRPMAERNFNAVFREWRAEAGLPARCTPHGLRKSAACVAAEGGATLPQMMAIFGWTKADTALIYIRRANRGKLAADAIHLLGDRPNTDGTNVSHLRVSAGSGRKKQAKK